MSYVVVDDFPTVDPDLVIVEVRGDNRVRGERAALPEPLHHVPVLPRGSRRALARVLESRRLPNGGAFMTGVLDGVVVLDLTMGIAGPVTGMLLADHGAQVTKIEPPGGDPTRALSAARRCGTAGKRSAVLDLHDAADRERVARARVARRRARRELRARHRRASSASTTTRCSRATRASCTARSPRTATTARTPTGPRSTRSSRRAPATSGRAAASPAARSRAWPASRPRSPTSSCPTTAGWPRPVPARSTRACRG